jgi:hypothetical protein
MSDAEAAFDAVAARFLGEPAITEGTGFGSNPGLRVDGHIFAMLFRGQLVVKLPATRCAELAAAGAGRSFEIGTRRMREWLVIAGPPDPGAWTALADDALAFVRA